MILNAVAIALKSLLGLVCDPVAGLVECPCIKRNAIGAANAVLSADLALSGVESLIPEETGLEVICRQQGEKKLYFVMNFKDEEQKLPAVFAGRKDLLKGTDLTEETVLKKYDVCLIEK